MGIGARQLLDDFADGIRHLLGIGKGPPASARCGNDCTERERACTREKALACCQPATIDRRWVRQG